MRKLIYSTLAAVVAGFIAFSSPALALSLDQARSSGLVGEQTSGYISAIKSSPDVDKLVADINSRRAAEYARIAKENGQSPAVVGKLAAPKIINGLPAGALYQDEKGAWKTR